ncbi:ohanin-like [Trachemys scripta elegans]|uniref:ohanin-like n=1 Tax=Trachemys scripta elegans TaxID=31138 RepID=UPI001555E7EA|nr:ohanin-like [Trachemys scripta elegans]
MPPDIPGELVEISASYRITALKAFEELEWPTWPPEVAEKYSEVWAKNKIECVLAGPALAGFLLASRPPSSANVTLDPDTAHPELIVSADRRSVRRGDTQPALPKNIERFDTALCVLGCEGFTSGRHYWEVDVKVEIEVEGKGFWAMGVARESVSRKGPLSFTPEQGIWALEGCEDEFWTHTLTEQFNSFSRSRAPNRIRVYLDYERGRVEFVNAGSGDVILTFPSASFAGEGIYPFFWVGFRGSGSRLTLCP